MILLSVLIPSIPSRIDRMELLFNRLQKQANDVGAMNEVEILCFLDNKKRSVGHKRDGLVQLARGIFCTFADDDDIVYDDYMKIQIEAIRSAPADTDVIVYEQDCTIDGGNKFKVRFGMEYHNEEASKNPAGKWLNITRKPFHTCLWRTALAQSERFADVSYGEDWDWCKRLVAKTSVSRQHRVNATPLCYVFNSKVTEADTKGAILEKVHQ